MKINKAVITHTIYVHLKLRILCIHILKKNVLVEGVWGWFVFFPLVLLSWCQSVYSVFCVEKNGKPIRVLPMLSQNRSETECTMSHLHDYSVLLR